MKKAKIVLVIIIIVIIVFAVLKFVLLPRKTTLNTNPTGGGAINIEIAKEIYGFSAEIKAINGKTLTLDASIPLADTTKTPEKISVKAVVDDTTKIVKLKFPKDIPADSKAPVYPEETPLNFSDLKVGDKINVAVASNVSDNIKNGTEITLTTIFIVEK